MTLKKIEFKKSEDEKYLKIIYYGRNIIGAIRTANNEHYKFCCEFRDTPFWWIWEILKSFEQHQSNSIEELETDITETIEDVYNSFIGKTED